MTNSLAGHITAAVRARGPAPLVTVYDAQAAPDSRIELSYTTVDNWASKVANWLVEEESAQPGDVCAVDATGGWRTFVTVIGCWKAGVGAGLTTEGGLLAEDHVLVYADDYDAADVDGGQTALVAGPDVWTVQQLLDDASLVDVRQRGRVATALPGSDPHLWRALVGVLAAGGALLWAPSATAETLTRIAASERATYLLTFDGISPL